ncbi:DUF7144 family membrane protein [Nocardioides albus]|uniref:Putative membrane protein YphA (DoxX/SURF4 family) n=1 Tax=Nocardioides albus TaxID=1841 RepID=A0A7W5A7P8_9ACTN|nr:hypothetical protein [Nocardioides albus]MBB3091102.1 putative membrane protein YphA (DoxX/SURF4 family) [Nocardioides albus]GGU34326.1 hypothetical protein GCM10007979_36830 [Nocardioides albus]
MSSTTRGGGYDSPVKTAFAFSGAIFASTLLTMVGIFQILAGIAAIAEDKVYVEGIEYVYQFDITTWGWIHLVLGVIAFVVGICMLLGQTWARVAGIVISIVGSVAAFAFMPYYPYWSLAMLALYIFVIWSLSQLISSRAEL